MGHAGTSRRTPHVPPARLAAPVRRTLPAILAFGAIAVGCSPRPPEAHLPPVPMDWPNETAQTAALEPRLPPGMCAAGTLATDDEIATRTVTPEAVAEAPVVIVMPPVIYPAVERDQGWEGTVHLRMLVGPDGRVAKVDIGDGRDPFVAAAAEAACGAQFTPVRSARGEPAYTWVTHTFPFTLNIAVPSAVSPADNDE